ncbi:unnamed protein product [Rotaria sp. Silwood2]|nr:unnamed protein product [Rotaria sp. Silwood2]CAF2835835.1 unnamed protein product [Rotaria sp. Silwood2]CAF3227276.1 unnamed protein product [Rotaria sp. Silwood2]CAF4040145.1 unnamed protein product [Rotaria sp. Silwood2]CAF4247802.1 unnamed protein product [Rotaria sp. Silwood2]
MATAILLQAQQERYRNLQPVTGDLSQDADEYIEQIGSIGSLTKEPDEVLHILLKVKLSGRAEWWYDNNKDSLGTWSQLCIGFRERFQQPPFSSPHLHDRHQLAFTEQLQGIKQEQNTLPVPISTSFNITSTSITSEKQQDAENNQLELFNDHQIEFFEDLENKCIHEHEQGRYSPILVNINDPDLNIQRRCTDETEDWNKLKQQDNPVIKSDSVKTYVENIFEPFVESICSLTADHSLINPVAPQDIQYLWSDKHRPRKLRGFKKVHTGYDWNQSNKNHYDANNPPPKTVPGYKFNIFYLDLIGKTKTPSYCLTVCENNRDFSILNFHAGSPYNDIAFVRHCDYRFDDNNDSS